MSTEEDQSVHGHQPQLTTASPTICTEHSEHSACYPSCTCTISANSPSTSHLLPILVPNHPILQNMQKTFVPDWTLFSRLVEIGVSQEKARRALFYTGNCSVEMAINWLQEEDKDFRTPTAEEMRAKRVSVDDGMFNFSSSEGGPVRLTNLTPISPTNKDVYSSAELRSNPQPHDPISNSFLQVLSPSMPGSGYPFLFTGHGPPIFSMHENEKYRKLKLKKQKWESKKEKNVLNAFTAECIEGHKGEEDLNSVLEDLGEKVEEKIVKVKKPREKSKKKTGSKNVAKELNNNNLDQPAKSQVVLPAKTTRKKLNQGAEHDQVEQYEAVKSKKTGRKNVEKEINNCDQAVQSKAVTVKTGQLKKETDQTGQTIAEHDESELVQAEQKECDQLQAEQLDAKHNPDESEQDQAQGGQPKLSLCWNCSSTHQISKCAGCRVAWYCGEMCQEEDWDRHGDWCREKEGTRMEQEFMHLKL